MQSFEGSGWFGKGEEWAVRPPRQTNWGQGARATLALSSTGGLGVSGQEGGRVVIATINPGNCISILKQLFLFLMLLNPPRKLTEEGGQLCRRHL